MIVGQRPQRQNHNNFSPKTKVFAKYVTEGFRAIKEETGVDLLQDPHKLMDPIIQDTIKDTFVNNSIANEHELSPEELEAEQNMVNEQFINAVEAIQEHTALGSFNPLVAMTIPVQKNLMMNTIYDKGSIQKAVALSPRFNISMKRRFLVKTDGTKLELAKDQSKLMDAIREGAPFVEVVLALPEVEQTDILSAIGCTRKDDLSIATHISEVKFKDVPKFDEDGNDTGTKEDVWVKTKLEFSAAYGAHNRTIMEDVKLTLPNGECITETITASMKDNKFIISGVRGLVTEVKLNAKRDTSSGMNDTPTVKWEMEESLIEIPDADYLSTTISLEESKDIAASYGVDQTAEVIEMITDVMGNYKDDTISKFLDEDWKVMDEFNKIHVGFDFAPTGAYALDPIEWRKKMFLDQFDSWGTEMLGKLNDPNMSFCTYGRPDLIRKIQPTTYNYTTPESVGPVTLDYNKTVVTSDNRKYSFLSSQKIKGDNLITLLRPENTNKIIYRIYDYQFYIGNQLGNYSNHVLPAVTTFERFKVMSYEPIQTRISMLNVDGYTEEQRLKPSDLIPIP